MALITISTIMAKSSHSEFTNLLEMGLAAANAVAALANVGKTIAVKRELGRRKAELRSLTR